MDYNNITDNVEIKNFLDKEKILEIVDEDTIFELVFGFKPVEFELITSPFRVDNRPGCWFEYSFSGRLKFIDWASEYYINGTKVVSMDCFDAVKMYFDLPNFYETLHFIYTHLIQGKELTAEKAKKKERKVRKKEKGTTTILIETRGFDARDAIFWKRYGISSEMLKRDKVFALSKYKILSSSGTSKLIRTFGISYAYTDFQESKKKIYSPYSSKKGKFITNCGKDDIGGLRVLSETGNKLVISKSYKDWRVLKNQKVDSIWFQNEGMFPTVFTLFPIFARFKEIIIFFDNDRAGKNASLNLENYLKNMGCTLPIRSVSLPDHSRIKDPSDLVSYEGEKRLKEFLLNVQIL